MLLVFVVPVSFDESSVELLVLVVSVSLDESSVELLVSVSLELDSVGSVGSSGKSFNKIIIMLIC